MLSYSTPSAKMPARSTIVSFKKRTSSYSSSSKKFKEKTMKTMRFKVCLPFSIRKKIAKSQAIPMISRT
jgi:hypothetical protein